MKVLRIHDVDFHRFFFMNIGPLMNVLERIQLKSWSPVFFKDVEKLPLQNSVIFM